MSYLGKVTEGGNLKIGMACSPEIVGRPDRLDEVRSDLTPTPELASDGFVEECLPRADSPASYPKLAFAV